MHIELCRTGGKPLPLQISEALGQRIASGLLQPGMRLPSVRKLAVSLGVSQVTVSKAYADLERRGRIVRRHGLGCFVSPAKDGNREDEEYRTGKAGRAGNWKHDAGKKNGNNGEGERGRSPIPGLNAGQEKTGTRKRFGWQEDFEDYLPRAQLWRNFDYSEAEYSFHLAAIHSGLLPLKEIGEAMTMLVAKRPELMSAYGNFQGDLELREVMTRHLRTRGISLSAASLMITSGTQQGIDLVARTFIGPGDAVYLEEPSYTGAIDVFAGRGAEMISVPMDEDGMRIDLLTKLCDRRPPKLIYTVPTFQNPSGATMSMERRQRLLELARSYRCLIVEDDPFSDLYFHSPPPPSIKSMDRDGHVVYMKSFSKVLAPGCRMACVAAEGDILERLTAAKAASDLGGPLLIQLAVLPFISDRYDVYMKGLRSALRSRMERAAKLLKRHAPQGVKWRLPEGGLNLWLELPHSVHVGELYRRASRLGISFLTGNVCHVGEPSTNYIRLCYAQMEEEQMERGLLLLMPLLKESMTGTTR
ncbi:MocR-like pyridoxine biosynthesis transcription factor PdxR [Paenibacillus sp. URB8-2]|uniref:MocR-like pyridoxine biosynthesis transcription factor PdxR n=1 Tax=Paenibacillus sp. URB8-2 TaxID=2741301 RepID=UPI0015C1C96D|nr:PLP-dependent aminotransferase family protein [Paenibacillus sp. URB8-2]BCG60277.1 GntR family transcriptional regulator [Paenibacillus sp. URB8-2]